jgi:hypothetical protein
MQDGTTDRDRTTDTVRLTWVLTLLDVPPGEFEVHGKAVPGRQREREFAPLGGFTLTVEDIDDAGDRRQVLDAVLERGSIPAGDSEITVDELWWLFRALLERPDSLRATVEHTGEPSFLRFLYLLAVRGTDPSPGTELTEPALPAIDVAEAAIDADPWIAAPALFLARKWDEPLDIVDLLAALGGGTWDAPAVDQALLYLAVGEGEEVRSRYDYADEAEVHLARINESLGEICSLDLLFADGLEDRTVRYQRPTTAGIEITTPEEPLYGWDGEMPTNVDPGEYRAAYFLGDPPVVGGPAQGDCPGGGALRMVLWREGMV